MKNIRNEKGQFVKGHIPHSKGKKISSKVKKKISLAHKGKKLSEEHKKKIGKANKISHLGKRHSEKTKIKIRKARKKQIPPMLGKKCSENTKRKIGLANSGKRCSFWKGGITPESRRIRSSTELKLWRESVFTRDNWTCQKYGIRGEKLHAHHIHNFADYPELRTSIENGITLSEKAHKEFHKKYGNKKITREQLEEFLKN